MTAAFAISILTVVALVLHDIARLSLACLARARVGEQPTLGKLGGSPQREREH